MKKTILPFIKFLSICVLLTTCQAADAGFDEQRPEGISDASWQSLRVAVQEARLLPTPEGVSGLDSEFGHAISLDGNRVLISGQKSAGSGAAFIFEYDGSQWVEQATLIPNDGEQNDRFGYSVSLDGDRALIGAHWDDDLGNFSGSAYLFEFDGSQWMQIIKWIPSDGSTGDLYGSAVSLSGDWAFVGAPGNDGNGTRCGAVYIYHVDGSTWQQFDKIFPADAENSDQFGSAISLSGSRVLISSPLDDNGSLIDNGSAYVFEFDNNSWNESTKLQASDGSSNDNFGNSVSISGNRALIGAKLDDVNNVNAGSVYVFDFDGLTWSESVKIVPSDTTTGIRFGQSVSLQGDVFVAGAHQNQSNGLDFGAAYVYQFDGSVWQEVIKLTASDKKLHDELGFSVAIHDDTIFAGAHHDGDLGSHSGSAYVFELGESGWLETQEITPAEGAANDYFGYSVSIDGDKALVGAPRDGLYEADSGAAYIYHFDGINWQQTAKLTTSNGDSVSFGKSVSLYGDRALVGASANHDVGVIRDAAYVYDFDGQNWNQTAKLSAFDAFHSGFADTISLFEDRAVIGCYGDDDSGYDAGAVFVYDFNGVSWQETAKLKASDGNSNDRFGISVSLFGDRILVGASKDDVFGLDSGSAYVFDYDGSQWNESQKISPTVGGAGDEFGNMVKLQGNRALLGAHLDDDLGTDSGSAYVFEFNGNSWQETAHIVPSDGQAEDRFGNSLDLSGDSFIVGSYLNNENGPDSGTAYLFEFDGNQWQETNKLTADDGAVEDQFGYAVSLSVPHALIGSVLNDDRGLDSGSAYIFNISRHSISGTVSGLASGNALVLQNNESDDLVRSENGQFEFNTVLDDGSSYAVSVLTQPTSPNQTCTVSGGSNGDGSGTIAGADVSDILVTCTTNQYNVYVDVSGLSGDGVSFINGTDQLTILNNGTQALSILDDLTAYDVQITEQPESPNQICGFTSPSFGHLEGGDVTITVSCVTEQYALGVDVNGLADDNTMILQNNGGDDLLVSANGQASFNTPLDDGSSYLITVLTQPTSPNQLCEVSAPSGQLNGAAVLDIQVNCVTDVHTIGGTVSGLAAGNSVTLTMNDNAELLVLTDNQPFNFNNPLTDGSSYQVEVFNQPTTPNQTCTVSNGQGTLAGADVTNLAISCVTNTYLLGGYVFDLIPDNFMVLRNNGGDDLVLTEQGAFVFNAPLQDGSAYQITIEQQPDDPLQSCELINDTGAIQGQDIDNILINCEFGDDLIYRHGFDSPDAISEALWYPEPE
jgi:hypothetical protein